MPNNDSPTKALMDNYLVSPIEITKKTGYSFPIGNDELYELDRKTISRPKHCSLK